MPALACNIAPNPEVRRFGITLKRNSADSMRINSGLVPA
jgi:hypothetical protein